MSSRLVSLLLVIIMVWQCQSKQIKGPPNQAEGAVKRWHKQVLCPSLKGLFTGAISYDDFFEKQWNFYFVIDGEEYSGDQYRKIVESIVSLQPKAAKTSGSSYISLSLCEYLRSGRGTPPLTKDDFMVRSKQKIDARLLGYGGTVSVQRVVYTFNKINQLKRIEMTSIVDPNHTLAIIIQKLLGLRTSLLDNAYIQLIMDLPTTVIVPVVLVIAIVSMIMVWKMVSFCCGFGTKSTKIQ
eukprot:101764_1